VHPPYRLLRCAQGDANPLAGYKIMKEITSLLIGLMLAGCSKGEFSPNMRGMGFWEPQAKIRESLNEGSFDALSECFSTFIIIRQDPNPDEYQLVRTYGMGKPELMAQRVTEKHTSLVRKEDIKSIEWVNVDPGHATGSFEFDAFYGSGKIIFKAIMVNGEWVLNYMSIPKKPSSGTADPFVIFDYSEDKAKLLTTPKQALKEKPIEALNIPEPSDEDLALSKQITGTWEMDNQVFILTVLSVNGDFQEQIYETKEKKKLFATVTGKWWITDGHYNYQVTKTVPEMEVGTAPYTFKIDDVTDTQLVLIDSSGGKETKTRIQ
jgi:hypothetical protein